MPPRPHFIRFGPAIPIVPVKNFSKLKLKESELADLWSLCGPSVERNLRHGIPLWEIITVAYYEGLNHAVGIMQERYNDSQNQDRRSAGGGDRRYSPENEVWVFVEGQFKAFHTG